MDAVIVLTGAERGFLMLIDPDTQKLTVRAARNFEGESLTQEESERGLASISRSVIRTTLEQGEGLISPNAQEDPRFANKESVVLQDPRSIMCTPLRWRGMVIGAISEDNRVRSGIFIPPDL